jgi:hypothetical protein
MPASISTASNLSSATALAVLLCTLAGLFIPDFYRLVPPVLLPGSYGQDWVSLAAVPVLVWSMRAATRGSPRGLIVWLGLLAYYLYAFALYAFGPQYTALYPLYVAVVGLSAFALVMVSLSLDICAFYSHLRRRLLTRRIAALFGTIVISLAPVWMAMVISAIRDGKPSLFTTVHVLDLAFVFPTLSTGAVGLWQRRPWSYALAGPTLILIATMMGSLVVSEAIAAARFTPDPLPLAVAFSLIALAASLLARHYLRLLPSETRVRA